MKNNKESIIRKILFNEITFVISIIAAAFAVYNIFAGPALKNEREITALKSNLGSYQQLQETITNLKDNHIHTIEVEQNKQGLAIERLNENIIRLSTIIEERIPAKK